MIRICIALVILVVIFALIQWCIRRKPHPQQYFFFNLVEKNLSDENQKKEDSYHDF
jgi:uncharacterized protein YggT (Ycf19 family)